MFGISQALTGKHSLSSSCRFKPSFHSEEKDGVARLYYFNARWYFSPAHNVNPAETGSAKPSCAHSAYDADTGRFVTEDPIRSGLNWYSYVSNNPLKFIDPSGLREIKEDPDSDQKELRGRRDAEREIRDLEKAQNSTTRDMSEIIERKQGEYNRKYHNASALEARDILPGSRTTTEFGEEFEFYDKKKGNYYGAIHGGLDKVGAEGQQEFSQAYQKLVMSENNTIVYKIIGMDRYVGGQHISSAEVSRMNGMLGKTFSPGDKIHRHPNSVEGDPTKGRHEHQFEYDTNEDFYNPTTHALPETQPSQWRKEAMIDSTTGAKTPGGYIYENARYRIPYMPVE